MTATPLQDQKKTDDPWNKYQRTDEVESIENPPESAFYLATGIRGDLYEEEHRKKSDGTQGEVDPGAPS